MSLAAPRQPLETILRRSIRAEADSHVLDLARPIDRSRWYVCPTLTPLYYTPIYDTLTEDQRRRYNQLTALCFNELIAFFEQSFAASVLAATARARRGDDEWTECLERFIREERRHIGWWRDLNRLSEPELYAATDSAIVRLPAAPRGALALLTRHPHWFPAVFWVMLLLEERSLDISRRSLRLGPDVLEPQYRAIYRRHLEDEVRHVQLDRELIARHYALQPRYRRWLNARLLGVLIGRFFLPPTRSAVRVIERLVFEYPELGRKQREMNRRLRALGDDPDYCEMMYSRRTTPLAFSLFDSFAEMHHLQRVLRSYRPAPCRIDAP
ncbi:MAG: diiron oxygenase [Planctomycetaceae bacterium]